jgi:hypothetical protein
VADRFPTPVQDYFERAPGRMLDLLADAFAELDRRGSFAVDDPKLAAEDFAYLAIGASLDRALFGIGLDPSAGDDPTARAIRGAAAFHRLRWAPTIAIEGSDAMTPVDALARLEALGREKMRAQNIRAGLDQTGHAATGALRPSR